MVSWNEFYSKLKEKVENIIKEGDVFEGQIQFNRIVGITLKECLEEDGVFKRRSIRQDDKSLPDKQILYRDDSKRKIKGVKR